MDSRAQAFGGFLTQWWWRLRSDCKSLESLHPATGSQCIFKSGGQTKVELTGYPAAGSPSYGPRKQIVLLHVSSIKKYFRTKAYTIEGPFESLKALTQCLGRGSCADLLQFQRRSWLHSLPGRGSCALQVLRSSHAPDSPGNLSHAW